MEAQGLETVLAFPCNICVAYHQDERAGLWSLGIYSELAWSLAQAG